MFKLAAVATLVLVPLIWGALMVPALDFIENLLVRLSWKRGDADE